MLNFYLRFLSHASSIQARLHDVLSGPKFRGSHLATWISCEQPRQHAIHLRPHSSTGTFRTRPTFSYGRTPYDAPWNHHRAASTKAPSAPTKHFRLSCTAGKPLFQQTGSSLRTCWKGLSTTPVAHQPSPPVHQQKQFHHCIFRGVHSSVALYASLLASPPKPFLCSGDVGPPTW
jgi:hypothetical protein